MFAASGHVFGNTRGACQRPFFFQQRQIPREQLNFVSRKLVVTRIDVDPLPIEEVLRAFERVERLHVHTLPTEARHDRVQHHFRFPFLATAGSSICCDRISAIESPIMCCSVRFAAALFPSFA